MGFAKYLYELDCFFDILIKLLKSPNQPYLNQPSRLAQYLCRCLLKKLHFAKKTPTLHNSRREKSGTGRQIFQTTAHVAERLVLTYLNLQSVLFLSKYFVVFALFQEVLREVPQINISLKENANFA